MSISVPIECILCYRELFAHNITLLLLYENVNSNKTYFAIDHLTTMPNPGE